VKCSAGMTWGNERLLLIEFNLFLSDVSLQAKLVADEALSIVAKFDLGVHLILIVTLEVNIFFAIELSYI
jgi:hypothetical protein